jgi:hypothetical protein
MLREIDRDIWVAERPLRYFGLSVGTRMTVIRLSSGELLVISPISIDDATVEQLDKLGTVSHIVAPNLYHYLFATDFQKLYPNALFWAAPGLDTKKPDLKIDRTIDVNSSSLWTGIEHIFFDGFRTLALNGFDLLNEFVFFHIASRTLILTDTAFHFDDSFPLVTQFATRIIGGYQSLSPSILEKIATTDKDKVSKSVDRVLNWDFDRVIMAHGSIIDRNGKEMFDRGYARFLDRTRT